MVTHLPHGNRNCLLSFISHLNIIVTITLYEIIKIANNYLQSSTGFNKSLTFFEAVLIKC